MKAERRNMREHLSIIWKKVFGPVGLKVDKLKIKEISVNNHSKGAQRGFGLGVLIGGVAGFSVGSLYGSGMGEEELGRLFGFIAGVPTGGITGLIIGAKKGFTDKYVISVPMDSTSKDH